MSWCRIVPVIVLGACTPLGLWVYEDPVVTVSRVTLELKEARGTHTFAVQGRATFRTPFGMREVRFEQEGAMMFGERPSSSAP